MSENLGPLDPSHYVEHVTRTALLLEQLARDVKSLKDDVSKWSADTEGLRRVVGDIERDLAVFKERTSSLIAANRESIESLANGLQWIRRAVISTLVAAIISGIIALVIKTMGG